MLSAHNFCLYTVIGHGKTGRKEVTRDNPGVVAAGSGKNEGGDEWKGEALAITPVP